MRRMGIKYLMFGSFLYLAADLRQALAGLVGGLGIGKKLDHPPIFGECRLMKIQFLLHAVGLEDENQSGPFALKTNLRINVVFVPARGNLMPRCSVEILATCH